MAVGIFVITNKLHRNASRELLMRAETAEAAQEWNAVESSLREYIHRNGESKSALDRIANAIIQGANSSSDRARAIPFLLSAVALNPGEWVDLMLKLTESMSLSQVTDALNSGALRTAIRVRGFSNGGGESFINAPNANDNGSVPAPEPGGIALLACAYAFFVKRKRREPVKVN